MLRGSYTYFSKRELWIAGKRYDGVWYWGLLQFGVRMLYKKWHPGHPSGDDPVHVRASVLYPHGNSFLQRDDMDHTRYFVCEMQPGEI